MTKRAGVVSNLGGLLAAVGLLVSTTAVPARALAEYLTCPEGYAPDPYYGCIPLAYIYGPPFYPYPVFGFDYLYGPAFVDFVGFSFGFGPFFHHPFFLHHSFDGDFFRGAGYGLHFGFAHGGFAPGFGGRFPHGGFGAGVGGFRGGFGDHGGSGGGFGGGGFGGHR